MKFAHTNIVSTNWKELADFYIRTFNCKIVPPIRNQSGEWLDKGTGLSNAQLEGVHLLLPGYGENGPTLEIHQYKNIDDQKFTPPNKRGYRHIAFEVESVQSILDRLVKNGGKMSGEITTRKVEDLGEITFVYARDPEGNLIELQSWR
ncbi:MAG: VOC family protein [Muriicola sp.]|nr:VOC family protein [Muriicola sp.]NNK10539.1 VOC family protein [Flavobacteriaceae bacterium]